MAYGGDDIFLTLPFQVGQLQFVYLFVLAQGSNQDGGNILRFGRNGAEHMPHVLTKILNGHLHPFVFLFTIANGGILQRQRLALGSESDKCFCSKRSIVNCKEGEKYCNCFTYHSSYNLFIVDLGYKDTDITPITQYLNHFFITSFSFLSLIL